MGSKMEQLIKNRDLFNNAVKGLDDLYVVTRVPQSANGEVAIAIDLNEDAVVLDECKENYPLQNQTVSDIRSGNDGRWLLSGGALIFDQSGRIAVGMRDGNAADPFAYTNIAAGRCDRKFQEHCYEELASEFVLCVKRNNTDWEQINFGESTPPLERVRQAIPTICKWKAYVKHTILHDEVLRLTTPVNLEGLTTVSIHWQENGVCQFEERIKGFTLLDSQNHTVEFRLPIVVDLSKYSGAEIFYGEGTGHATWIFPAQILDVLDKIQIDGGRKVTPFLAWVAKALACE